MRAYTAAGSAMVQWKTVPGMLATALVGTLVAGNDSHGAADRVATGAAMYAFRAGFTRLAPQNVFEAFIEIATWIAVARGGAIREDSTPAR